MTPHFLIDEPPPSRSAVLSAVLGAAAIVAVAFGGQALVATAYAAALLPLLAPLLHRAVSPARAAKRAAAKLIEGRLVWRSGGRVRRLGHDEVEGGALLTRIASRPTLLLCPRDGSSLLIYPAGTKARNRATSTFGLDPGRTGKLRFFTARRFPAWELLLRSVPLAGVLAFDAKLGFGWSVYLLILPPFPLGLFAMIAVALSGPKGPVLTLDADAVFWRGKQVATYASIQSVVNDETSVTLSFVAGVEMIHQRFVLARGHEFQAEALRECLEDAVEARISRK